MKLSIHIISDCFSGTYEINTEIKEDLMKSLKTNRARAEFVSKDITDELELMFNSIINEESND